MFMGTATTDAAAAKNSQCAAIRVRAERQAVILYDAEEKTKGNRNAGEFGGRIARPPNDDAQTLAGLGHFQHTPRLQADHRADAVHPIIGSFPDQRRTRAGRGLLNSAEPQGFGPPGPDGSSGRGAPLSLPAAPVIVEAVAVRDIGSCAGELLQRATHRGELRLQRA
jgi:hypothetical protein